MLVSWASSSPVDAAAATVTYGRSAAVLDVTVYGGVVSSYSSLQFFEPDALFHPHMDEVALGENAVTAAELCRILATPEYLGGAPPSCANASRTLHKVAVTGTSSNADHIYTSPHLVTVKLQNLLADSQYFYACSSGSERGAVRSFWTPPPQAPAPGAFPMHIALLADVGQTVVSAAVIKRLAADAATRLVLLGGDWSYADGFGPKWDVWERLMEPLASRVPVMGCSGNHEIERGEAFVPLIARHPTPYVAAKSASPLDYAFVAGPAAVIVLNAYAGARGLPAQAEWLRGALSRVERARTPWLIVVFHTPWYSSNNARSYTRAGEPLRWAVEHILFEAGVDIVLSGHIHAYERSHPVFNRTRTACGPTHLCVGDAGAHGGPMVGWKLPAPDWSAFRSASFGAGKLVLVNETHAHWVWSRVACARTANTSNPEAHWDAEWDAAHCSTSSDSSAMAHAAQDEAWIVRDAKCVALLSARQRSTTDDDGDGEAGKGEADADEVGEDQP